METLTQFRTNVEIVQHAYADFESGNINGIINACTNDVVWIIPENPGVPITGTFEGKEGIRNFFDALSDNVEYSYFKPKEFFNDKEVVIVLGHQTGKVKKTGKTFNHDWCMVFRLRANKMYHYYAYVDTRDQAEAFKM
jgi:ketosteroid isomerase-like protein